MKKSEIKKLLWAVLPLFFTVLLLSPGCELATDPKIETIGGGNSGGLTGNVTITGTVLDASANTAVDSVSVRVIASSGVFSGSTNSSGVFVLNFNLTLSQAVTLILTKGGYLPDTTTVFASVNNTNSLLPISLQKIVTTGSSGVSGPPSSIYLLSQSVTSIGVRQSGSLESGRLTFQVVDSLGRSISLSNSSVIRFKFGAAPGGGEFLSPDVTVTDSNGQASVFLTSGIIAGVVQITAEIVTSNRTITSLPVSIVIHGGLPDPDHFSVASGFLNFAGFNIFGLENSVTAFVGDKYGNPVRPGTKVYFTTTGGIILGSAETDNAGRATVNLLSAAPQPIHPTLGAGFATVTASTADENSSTISVSTIVLFSGVPVLTIQPGSGFDIPNAGSQEFIYEVKDQNNNPLAPGTAITVTVEGENVDARGNISIQMGDTQSRFATRYSFVVTDNKDTVNVPKPVFITVSTTGSNGRGSIIISGISR
ncbi:MAG: Ig-like domain-containing protein [Ignavibacteriaceae bacterium]|nr:Ig-like domain-containing protein [Ignavibacteriaceae bacterium]